MCRVVVSAGASLGPDWWGRSYRIKYHSAIAIAVNVILAYGIGVLPPHSVYSKLYQHWQPPASPPRRVGGAEPTTHTSVEDGIHFCLKVKNQYWLERNLGLCPRPVYPPAWVLSLTTKLVRNLQISHTILGVDTRLHSVHYSIMDVRYFRAPNPISRGVTLFK